MFARTLAAAALLATVHIAVAQTAAPAPFFQFLREELHPTDPPRKNWSD